VSVEAGQAQLNVGATGGNEVVGGTDAGVTTEAQVDRELVRGEGTPVPSPAARAVALSVRFVFMSCFLIVGGRPT
jgi:hypothetical protein